VLRWGSAFRFNPISYVVLGLVGLGEQRAGMLYHAVDTVFSVSFREHKPQVARDLDATSYTIPFNETIRSLNG
jgi:hypothetical protein